MDTLTAKPPKLSIGNVIGTGAFCVVYEGEWNGNPAAIKRPHPQSPQAGERQDQPKKKSYRDVLWNAGLLLKQLNHRHIVKFFELSESKEFGLVLVQERMRRTLKEYLKRHAGKLSRQRQIDMCLQIADVVHYVHSQQPPVVCRDLSRLNFYLSPDDMLKFCPSMKASRMPSCGFFDKLPSGLVSYMPPEAVVIEPHYNEKVDVFSMGVLILEIATQHFATIALSNIGKVPEIDRRVKDLSLLPEDHPLKPIILQCLRDDPGERPNSGAVFKMLSEGETLIWLVITHSHKKAIFI